MIWKMLGVAWARRFLCAWTYPHNRRTQLVGKESAPCEKKRKTPWHKIHTVFRHFLWREKGDPGGTQPAPVLSLVARHSPASNILQTGGNALSSLVTFSTFVITEALNLFSALTLFELSTPQHLYHPPQLVDLFLFFTFIGLSFFSPTLFSVGLFFQGKSTACEKKKSPFST